MPGKGKDVEVYFTGICVPSYAGIPCFAFVVRKEDETIYSAAGIGDAPLTDSATTNAAEYKGLIKAMEWLQKKSIKKAFVFGDSEVVVKQVNGTMRTKSPRLMDLVEKANRLAGRFEHLDISVIPRAKNSEAIALAVESLEEILDDSPEMVKKIAPGLASQKQTNYLKYLKVKYPKYVSRKEARSLISEALRKKSSS